MNQFKVFETDEGERVLVNTKLCDVEYWSDKTVVDFGTHKEVFRPVGLRAEEKPRWDKVVWLILLIGLLLALDYVGFF